MTIYYAIVFFIFGLLFGSFYNVVAYRIPKKESIVFPSSHCTTCGHKLTVLELIPVISFLIQGGKCKHCGEKISWFYTIFELLTGLLFMLSFLIFGFSIELIIALIFVSICDITIISDYKYMVILDEVLIIGGIGIIICLFINNGISNNSFDIVKALKETGINLLHGLGAFLTMYIIKIIGDLIFKRESMGGGDIKLMAIFGLVLGYINSLVSIALASFIGLPITLFLMKAKKGEEIPFGPFLVVGALILFFTKFNITSFLGLY